MCYRLTYSTVFLYYTDLLSYLYVIYAGNVSRKFSNGIQFSIWVRTLMCDIPVVRVTN